MQKSNDKLYFMNFTFNEVPDLVIKSLAFVRFILGFSERLKLKDDALPTIPFSSHYHYSFACYYR